MKNRTSLFAMLMVLPLLGVGYAQQNQTNPNVDNQKAAVEDSHLKVVHRVPPIYPPAAKAKGIEGTVVVEVLIDKHGKLAKARIISGPEILGDAALKAIKAWKFEPATAQGQPVEETTQIKVAFCNSRACRARLLTARAAMACPPEA